MFKIEDNFASIDYAVYKAGQLGMKLIVPLTGTRIKPNANAVLMPGSPGA